jgi:ureidoacrylate peracid hydrolase
MHRFELSPAAIARSIAIRGKAHVLDVIDPAKTALLVIDMQNYFMAPGEQCEVPMAREIVPTVNRLANRVRIAGGQVIWIRNGTDNARDWTVMHNVLMTPSRRELRYKAMDKGGFGLQLWEGLEVRPDDANITKTRYSAFIGGSSNVEAFLRKKGIDTLLISGTTTDVCCESTARDAMMLNYKVVMVSDANAAFTDEIHAAALCAFYASFGDVLTASETMAALAVGAANRTVTTP